MKQFLLCTIALLCVLLVPQLSAAKEHRSEQIIGYFTEWGANAPSNSNPYTLKNVASSGAAKILTQLDYAFGKVVDDRCQLANSEIAFQHRYDAASSVNGSNDPEGPNQLRGTFHQLKELKQLYPSLKIIISLGGWGGSAGFSSAAEPEHVTEFVRSCVDLFIRGHFSADITEEGVFDGVDLDWEYPVDGGLQPGKPEDKQDFTALAAEFRRQLDAVRPGLLLTAALPAEPEYYGHFDLPQISRYLDYISIMAYDLHWNTEKQTNFHSALYHAHADPSQPPLNERFGDFAVRGFLAAGVPPSKIILGVPFYGKGWSGVPDKNHGLYQSATSPAQDGGSFRDLNALAHGADKRYYKEAVSCTVWYNNVFWSYDCERSMHQKATYVRHKKLGGMMFWELSQDTAGIDLLRTIQNGLVR
jgi:chitinase